MLLWTLLSGCFLLSAPEAVLRDVERVKAEHAMAMPIARFAYPAPSDDGWDCDGGEYEGPLAFATLDVTLDGIYEGERQLAHAEGGLVPDDEKRGQLIGTVYETLLHSAEYQKDAAMLGCVVQGRSAFEGRLLLNVDARVPWSTVHEVVFTAGQAQFGWLAFRVDDAAPDPFVDPPRQRGEGAVNLIVGSSQARLVTDAGEQTGVLESLLDGLGSAPVVAFEGDGTATTRDLLEGFDRVASQEGHALYLPMEKPSDAASASTALAEPTPPVSLGLDATVPVLVYHLGDFRLRREPTPVPGPTTQSPGPAHGVRMGEPVFLGAIDQENLVEVVTAALPDIAACRTLDPETTGKIVVKFVVSKQGTVSSVSKKSSTLGSPELEICIPEKVGRLRFDPPRGGGIAIVSYPFVLEPIEGNAERGETGGLGSRAGTSPEGALATGHGPAEPAAPVVDQVVGRHYNQLRYCYQRELAKDPTLQGRAVFEFTVEPNGAVTSATVIEDTYGKAAVTSCMRGRFLRMHFPSESAGTYRYPVALTPP